MNEAAQFQLSEVNYSLYISRFLLGILLLFYYSFIVDSTNGKKPIYSSYLQIHDLNANYNRCCDRTYVLMRPSEIVFVCDVLERLEMS